jgi:hypothetical protein
VTAIRANVSMEAIVNGKVCTTTTTASDGTWRLTFGADSPCGPKTGDVVTF